MLDFSILTNNMDLYLEGFKYTIIASLIALVASFVLGTIIAVMRIAPLKIVNVIGTVYVEFIRNIPLVVIVFLFLLWQESAVQRTGVLGLTIYTAAFIAEAIRAGIMAVPKGQLEAARSSGLTYGQAMRFIILPQAIKIVIPPLGNQFINLVKNSSVLGIVAGFDLMYQADLVSSQTYVVFDVYIFVALFYLVLTIPLSLGVGYLEKRLGKTS
ncbi:amino acid ABC transporter permease [Bacillus megaterium]|nr:amino acid ABC transporter permease [Priestia megaterium]